MKNTFLVLAAGILLSANAYAYTSAQGNDPLVQVPVQLGGEANTGYTSQGSVDIETKSVIQTATTGFNDAIVAGNSLYYSELGSDITGLQTVSLISKNTGTDQASVTFQACIATKAIATGYSGAFQCQTRGYASALYDVHSWTCAGECNIIKKGSELCISTLATNPGKLIPCASGVVSKIKALEPKAGATQGSIKVLIDSE